MDYAFKIEPKEGYLHVRVSGNNDRETVMRYLKDVYDACLASGCPNVLIEENLFGSGFNLTEIFEVVSERSRQVWPVVGAVVTRRCWRARGNQFAGSTVHSPPTRAG